MCIRDSLGNVNCELTRTQVGIPLAALICASSAVIISSVSKTIRLITIIFLIIAVFLLLVTGSVASILASICGITILLIVALRHNSIKRYFVIIPMVIIFVFAGWSLVP